MTTIPESHRDLLDAQVATLGTIDGRGRPQLSVLWFLAEDDVIRLSLNTARAKVKNLQRNPAFSLLLLDLASPDRYLELRGDAEIAPDPDYTFAAKVGLKYGMDLREMDGPGQSRVVVTMRPSRVRTWG
jgi:PPOX class probable F420-dependent enzyme